MRSPARSRSLLGRMVVAAAVLLAVVSIAASVNAGESTTGFKAPTAAVPLSDGGFLVTDYAACIVKRVAPNGAISPFAGTGECATTGTGDGGPATSAKLVFPTTAVQTADGGTLLSSYFFVDCRVRKVSPGGTITTVAGTGTCGSTGDGGPATSANVSVISVVPFNAPGQAVQSPGSGYLITGGCVVRKVDGAGTISTVAGTECQTGPAALNAVSCVTGLCVAAGIDAKTSTSTTPATPQSWKLRQSGTDADTVVSASCPTASFCLLATIDGDVLASNNPAAAAPTWTRTHITVSDNLLREVSCVSATLCVAGDQKANLLVSTNPGAASPTWTSRSVDFPTRLDIVGLDCANASLCVASTNGGDVFTTTDPAAADPGWVEQDVAAEGLYGMACPSTTLCVAGSYDGKLYTSTNPASGATATWTPTPVAGAGHIQGVSCPTTSLCVAVDSTGNSITSTNPSAASPTWTLRSINGTRQVSDVSCASASLCVGVSVEERLVTTNPGAASPTWTKTNAYKPGFDGVPATSQPLNTPISAVPTADGGFLVAEYESNTIRKVAANGIITRVAGTGTPGFGGDGGQASAAQLYQPTAAVPTADGGFLIAELGNCVIRKVSAAGVISTVAGTAPGAGPTYHCGTDGTGGAATSAELYKPTAAVPFPSGGYLVGAYGAPPGASADDAPVSRVNADGTLVPAVGPAPTATATPTATPTASPDPGPGTGPGPGPIATPGPGPQAAAPKCTLAVKSARVGRKRPALKLTARCDQAASIAVTGKLKVTPKKRKGQKKKPKATTIKLAAVRVQAAAGVPVTISVKLPKKAAAALKKGARESAQLTLTGTNGNGKASASVKLARLKR